MIKSNRGQLSIFMGITLILVMGMLAFIVNIGLFVKAKINLQNAVDAAAFSGAATQARQLTNIAYVNWEMRNTYKEWMFKYYILGQMGLVKGANNLSEGALAGSTRASFLLKNPGEAAGNAASIGYDKYNIPTICIHNNSSTDICPIYALPGIPRFPAIGVAGISDIHEAFVNKLVEEKAENCSTRTKLNFLAALSWAYSSGIKEIPGAPLIATNRTGAWPEALELAMRMRNLEMIVNRPPVENIDYTNMNALAGTGADVGLNERPVKAFMSAFRNLGGGRYKDKLAGGGAGDTGNGYDELAATFKLTEIAPQPFQASELSVSGFLIPSTFTYSGEASVRALTKHYLDLQVVPINFATMFTTFVPGGNEFESTVQSESNCRVSKTALPVPGYIMGFVKNPAVLTYYAVKGEAEFTGLFFPRLSEDQPASFKLTAYAAAKPFGGRIGPKLFGFVDGDKSVIPRTDDNAKSSGYISGIKIPVSAATGFAPGMPIPHGENFWTNDINSLVGGVPGSNPRITYGIPNMIYTFDSDSELAAQNSAGISTIQNITAKPFAGASTSESNGLYNSYQIRELKRALGGDYTGRNMTSEDIMRALISARQVTKYDAANFLIPDFNRGAGAESTNAAPTVKKVADAEGGKGFYYKLFAPLFGEGLLYTSNAGVASIVVTYMKANDQAVDTYLTALLQVAKSIYDLPAGKGNTTNLNAQAAQSIHANAGISPSSTPPDLVSGDPMDANAVTCKQDMASKFNHFFRKSQTQCGITPLEELMVDYIAKKNQGDGKIYYTTTYFNQLPKNMIMTAYYPGTRQGTAPGNDATAINPIGATNTAEYSTRRNFYSTKFIPLSQLFLNSSHYKQNVFLESDTKSPSDIQNLIQQNPVNQAASGMGSNYFLDF